MIASKRLLWVVPLLVVVAIVMAGCGASPTQVAEQDGGFLLALPRITIDVDGNGSPSVAGLSPAQIKAMTFGQVDLSGLQFPKEYVDWFTTTNLQNVELVHKDDGMFMFVNGMAMPHVGWSGDSLARVSDVASSLGLLDARTARLLKILLPFAERLGVDVALRFPVKEGNDAIPLRDPSAPIPVAAASTEEPMAQIHADVTYDDSGVPSILAVSTRDLEEAFGVSMRQMELAPSVLDTLKASNIQHITIESQPDGLHVFVNGDELPSFVWGDDYLKNAADLYGKLYDPNIYGSQYQTIQQAMSVMLPMLNNLDAKVVLKFPTAEGAEEIPLPTP